MFHYSNRSPIILLIQKYKYVGRTSILLMHLIIMKSDLFINLFNIKPKIKRITNYN